MPLFICTAGTSIAGGPSRPGESPDDYRARIDQRLRGIQGEQPEAFFTRASAETHGLIRGDVCSEDEVVFLVSETEDGRITGDRLASLVEKEIGCRARLSEVRGLQVHDSRAFRRIGINALFDAIDRLTKDRSIDEINLHVTGGYKGIIPYVVLYGMFCGIPVSYIYEFSDTLITLPTFPLEFDWERLMPAQDVILTLLQEGAIEETKWRELLPPDYAAYQDRYDTLFEFEDGFVTLSAMGLLMKGRLDTAEAEAEVLLSPHAFKALAIAGAAVRSHLDAMIDRVRSPLHRAGFKHAESLYKTDMKVWKVYGSSGPRMLYWIEGDRVYVGELFAHHDAYEAYLAGSPLTRRDYDKKSFIQVERREGPDYQGVLADLRQLNKEPAQRARALEEEVRALRIELNKARSERNAIRKSMHEQTEIAAQRATKRAREESKMSLDRAYSRLRSKETKISELEVLVENLNGDIHALRGQIFGDETAALQSDQAQP
jgi:putative CRISPR-associated protein (TIGR02619 family)